jgi:hypothetical protein
VLRDHRPDRDAEIKQRLRTQALYFATGGGVVILSWAVLQLVVGIGDASHSLARVAWWLVRASVAVSALGLVVTMLTYLHHRRARRRR